MTRIFKDLDEDPHKDPHEDPEGSLKILERFSPGMLACEHAHIWEQTRERQTANSKARRITRARSISIFALCRLRCAPKCEPARMFNIIYLQYPQSA